jgi:hypothetical protein
MDELSEHRDLRGSGHWSVITYVHGKECIVLLCLLLSGLRSKRACLNPLTTRPFCSSMSYRYIETRCSTGGLEVVENLYNI